MRMDWQLNPYRNTMANNFTANLARGDSLMVEQPLFQADDGGSIPTSPLQLNLRLITKKTAVMCYAKWHYLGGIGFLASYHWGVFFNNRCFGAISFGYPNAWNLRGYYDKFTQSGWFEIKRLALSDDLPKNSESRVIAVAIRLLQKHKNIKGIISLADDSRGHNGTIYKAAGFKYLGLTAPKKDFFVDGKIQQRGKTKGINGEWRPRSRKHLFVKTF